MLSREKHKISYLHFVMSVLVILIHSINNDSKLEKLFSIESGIGQFAVPLFFMISGFLFFVNIKSVNDVRNKLKKRIYTLLIPFLSWNLIYYAIHLFLKPGSGISMDEFVDALFAYKYNPAFWFMYQLILLCIISPLIYYIVNIKLNNKLSIISKEHIAVGLMIISLLMIACGTDMPYVNGDAFIYYVFGYLIAILYNKGRYEIIRKKNIVLGVVSFVAFFILNRYVYGLLLTNPSFYNLFTATIILVRICGAIFLFYIFDLFFSYDKVPKYMENTFFLYAIHYMIVKMMIILMKFFMYKLLPNNISLYVYIECAVFVLSPVVCVIINYYLSRFLMARFKKQYNILVGNRV